MLKQIGESLWQRVVVAYKSTLIGLGLVAADAVVSSLQAAQLPQWAHALIGVLAAVLALYKGKQPAPAPSLQP